MIDPSTIQHEVRLGDCLGPEGLALLPDKSVDHVICDPPYEAEAHTLQRRIKRAGGVLALEPIDFPEISSELRLGVAQGFARIVRRWAAVFCQAEAISAWREALTDAGLVYKRAVVWTKPDAMPQLTGDRPANGFEFLCLVHAPGRSRWNGGGKTGLYEVLKYEGGGEPNPHPTTKPLALIEALVRDFTDPGELVCDPFAGSGTTGVACKRLGRRFIGWELDPKYHAIAVKRIENAREQLRMPWAEGA